MMLSPSNRLQIKEILKKIESGKDVSFEERVLLSKFANVDSSVANWLKRAIRSQQQFFPSNEMDQLLYDLDLGSSDPESTFSPERDDIGEWFTGAPSWLSRS